MTESLSSQTASIITRSISVLALRCTRSFAHEDLNGSLGRSLMTNLTALVSRATPLIPSSSQLVKYLPASSMALLKPDRRQNPLVSAPISSNGRSPLYSRNAKRPALSLSWTERSPCFVHKGIPTLLGAVPASGSCSGLESAKLPLYSNFDSITIGHLHDRCKRYRDYQGSLFGDDVTNPSLSHTGIPRPRIIFQRKWMEFKLEGRWLEYIMTSFDPRVNIALQHLSFSEEFLNHSFSSYSLLLLWSIRNPCHQSSQRI